MKTWNTQNGVQISRLLSGRCNIYLVSRQEKHLLIDASSTRDSHILLNRLEKLGVTADNLAALILTHAHFDHTENAALLKEKFKCRVIINALEAGYLRKGDNAPIAGSRAVTRRIVEIGVKIIEKRLLYQPVEPDILADERFDLNPLGFDAYIIHTPGHTPGSMSVVVDNEIALVGDAMSGILGSIFPVYATDTKALIASWKKLLECGCMLYPPGHGEVVGRERVEKQYKKYSKR